MDNSCNTDNFVGAGPNDQLHFGGIYSHHSCYCHHCLNRRVHSGAPKIAKGKFHELKGKVKEVAGKISDNPKLEAEGTGEKLTGKLQENIGQVKKIWGQ